MLVLQPDDPAACFGAPSANEPPGMPIRTHADHEAIIRTLRADLATVQDKHADAGTSDFLTGLMEKHEKMAWMLRAFNESAK